MNTHSEFQAHRIGVTNTRKARHGADRLEIYVTEQGFNPEYQFLNRGGLELVKKTCRYPSQAHCVTDVATSGYSGRHVVVAIWKASQATWARSTSCAATSPSTDPPGPHPVTPARRPRERIPQAPSRGRFPLSHRSRCCAGTGLCWRRFVSRLQRG
ncbi:lytic polysaccharide monooxygenase [Streptomyces sp. NPDC050085]|uniref:lytic polysaccharide monooxygenase n=1 Tax=Streptomyces sp. NPDC050085 TaxID=3365600 RepID=UPI003793B41A